MSLGLGLVDRGARLFRSGATGLLGFGAALAGTAGMQPVGRHGGDLRDGDADEEEDEDAAFAAQGHDGGEYSDIMAARKYRYDRLNLAIPADESEVAVPDLSSGLVSISAASPPAGMALVRERRQVSMFWEEKLALVLFFLQMHALIWLQCYQYYPLKWREWWRWTLLFILDVHHLIRDSGGSNTASDSMVHSVFILALALASVAMYLLLKHTVYADRVAGSTAPDRHWVSFMRFQRWSLLWAEFLFVPLMLLWSRSWTCGSQNQLFWLQSTWTCWEGPHIVLFFVVSIVSLSFCGGLMALLYTRTKRLLVFHDPVLHERYLQAREMEYLLGVNNLYEYTSFYFMGSFKRAWAWNRLIQLVQKVLVTVLLLALGTMNAGDHLILQAVLILVLISGPPCLNFLWRTYRCPSSNALKAVLDMILFFTCVMNVIEANPVGFVSSFIDPNTFSAMMLLVNMVGIGGGAVVILYVLTRGKMAQARALVAGSAVSIDLFWPVSEMDLWALHKAVPELLSTLNAGKKLLDDARGTAEEFYPRQHLLEAVNAMRTLLHESKQRREGRMKGHRSSSSSATSALERARHRPSNRALTAAEEVELRRLLRLGEAKAVALEWTLQDMIEDMALLYNTLTARAGGEKASSSSAAAMASSSAAGSAAAGSRVERMRAALTGFSESLSAKQLDRALMHPYKRDFLARMLALRGIVAAGNDKFVFGERQGWAPPIEPVLDENALPVGLSSVQVRYDGSRVPAQPSPMAAASTEMHFRVHAPLVQPQLPASDEEQV